MRTDFPTAARRRAGARVGLAMAAGDLDLMPIVDDDGALAGVMTERALARRYISESREVSSLVDTPTSVSAIVDVLEGRLVAGEDRTVDGPAVGPVDGPRARQAAISEGDVVVVGDRADAQRLRDRERRRRSWSRATAARPARRCWRSPSSAGTAVVSSPLDSYVTGAHGHACRALPRGDGRRPAHRRAPTTSLATSPSRSRTCTTAPPWPSTRRRRPIGIVTRADLVDPPPRRVLLVDHAEQAQSVRGIEEAEIVEILDHHHIGSIETRIPVTATFDPVGTTATLVAERFRQAGLRAEPPGGDDAAGGGALRHGDPQLADHDRARPQRGGLLRGALEIDARSSAAEMFEATLRHVGRPADEIVRRDAKEYEAARGQLICIAQVETVGAPLLAARRAACRDGRRARARRYVLFALMVTDIVREGTQLLVAGDTAPVERAFGVPMTDGVIELPGVMSRKKQVAPRLLGAV